MTPLDRLIEHHKGIAELPVYFTRNEISRAADTALALAELRSLVPALKVAEDMLSMGPLGLAAKYGDDFEPEGRMDQIAAALTTAAKWMAEEAQEKKSDA